MEETNLMTLLEMFPDKPIEYLQDSLNSTGGDLEEASIIVLSDSTSNCCEEDSNYKNSSKEQIDMHVLLNMFPGIPKSDIETAVAKYKKKEDIIAFLLDFDLLNAENAIEQKNLERTSRDNRRRRLLGSSDFKLDESVHVIMEYTDASESLAKQMLYRCSSNSLLAIATIIKNGKQETSKRNLELPKKFSRRRVQINGDPLLRKSPQQSQNSFKILQEPKTKNYKYMPGSKEDKQIKNSIELNVNLKGINTDFWQKALEYYNGDVKRTLSLAGFFIDNKATKYTYPNYNSPSLKPKAVTTVSSSSTVKNKQKLADDPRWHVSFQNEEANKTAKVLIDTLYDTYKIDLHGFLPTEAVRITQVCLEKWWQEEMRLRELNRHKLDMQKACNLPPVTIITGRGIHSVGGVPKVRPQVKKFLDNFKYCYDEATSFFTVTGKK